MSKTYVKHIIITIEGDSERATLTRVSAISTTTQTEGSQMPRESGSNLTGMSGELDRDKILALMCQCI